MLAMQPMFEFFDHTADMGIRVRAATVVDLFAPAAKGLYAAFGELVPRADDPKEIAVILGGTDEAQLLRGFLHELLLLFERDGRMATSVEIRDLQPTRLIAVVTAHPVDRERSSFDREVKAITYHELAIRPIEGGYEATLIVDI
jgi:SHS2 domain-containing protein